MVELDLFILDYYHSHIAHRTFHAFFLGAFSQLYQIGTQLFRILEKIGNALRLFAGGVFTEKCAAAIMKGIEVKELGSGHELGIELPKVTRIAFAAQVYVLTILVLILLNSQFTA